MKRLHRAWTEEENRRLVDGVEAGMSPARAAAMLKRTMTIVRTQARKLGKNFMTISDRRRALIANEMKVTYPRSVPVKKKQQQVIVADEDRVLAAN
jgi:hypothetical protein